MRSFVPSAAEANSENPGAAFPFRETLKGRLLGNGFGFDAKLCGFVSNWALVMRLLAGVHLREGASSHMHTHTNTLQARRFILSEALMSEMWFILL